MERHLLVEVDTPLTLATQNVLHTVGYLLCALRGSSAPTFANFTEQEVTCRFLPHQTHTVGRKKRMAATCTLEHVAQTSVHGLQEMYGEA